MKILYMTDPHGSTTIIEKTLLKAEQLKVNVVIIGGDLTSKYMVQISASGNFISWKDPMSGSEQSESIDSLSEIQNSLASIGVYSYLESMEEDNKCVVDHNFDSLFERLVLKRLKMWTKLIDEFSLRSGIKVYVTPGNDDNIIIDPVLMQSKTNVYCEESIVKYDGYQFVSFAYIPPSPWNTPRELEEKDILSRLESIYECLNLSFPLILCAHCPPYASGLDNAPSLKKKKIVFSGGIMQSNPVGSKSLRYFLENADNIVLALHGHIHESPGYTNIGNTLCLNPGSEYGRGFFQGYFISISNNQIDNFRKV